MEALAKLIEVAMWYLLKRALQMMIILAVLSVALFGLLSSMPGNPVDLLITSNPNVKPEDIIRLKRLRGLDKPWYIQYTRWILGYKEPARPPEILNINPITVTGSSLSLDLTDYIIDPNFQPSTEDLNSLLDELWPLWKKSSYASDMKKALKEYDQPALMLSIAKHDTLLQYKFIDRIHKESSRGLVVDGLFGAKSDGVKITINDLSDKPNHLWFLVRNEYGQEKVGRIDLEYLHPNQDDIMRAISTKVVEDDSKPFIINLNKFLANSSNSDGATFHLLDNSVGHIENNTVYRHKFTGPGQTVVKAEVVLADGQKEHFAFEVERGVIGHKNKYNRGFLYFFAGDRNALGFSQTYKRPVYDLLFGPPSICGNKLVDVGETCDDGNQVGGDGCSEYCFRESDSFWHKADATASGMIVRSGRIGNTIQLMLPALLLSLLIAIPLGVFSAYRQYSILDYIVNFLAFIGISLPVFWFGIMMIYLFAENFQIFPAGGVQTPGIYGQGTWHILQDRLTHAVLPTIVLSIFYVGRWLRYMRASMLEVLPKDYIRTARAKGLSERKVILKHAFRNALIPVVTVLALSIPSLFGGAVLTETVFSWPGVGRLQYEAVMNSDYYVAIVVFLVAAVLVMFGNLLADAVYVLVDPRIRKK